MSVNFSAKGKFLGASKPKTLNNGKDTRNFWLDITDNPEYPNTPEFNLYADKCEQVDGLNQGDLIEVTFNIQGRKYDNTATGGKKGVFTKLQAWKVEKIVTDTTQNLPTQEPVASGVADPIGGDDDQLPF